MAGHHAYDGPYVAYLESVVKAFTDRGVAVIVQMAQSKWSPAFRNIPVRGGGIRCQGYGMPAWLYPDAGSISIDAAKLRFFSSPTMRQGYRDAWTYVAARFADPGGGAGPRVSGMVIFTAGSPTSSSSFCFTLSGDTPGKMRQLTLARARCGRALVA